MSQHILATMAGGAADCSFWIRHLAMQVGAGEFRTPLTFHEHMSGIPLPQARLYEVENEGHQLTVRRASKLLANNIARYRGSLRGLLLFVGAEVMWSIVDRAF